MDGHIILLRSSYFIGVASPMVLLIRSSTTWPGGDVSRTLYTLYRSFLAVIIGEKPRLELACSPRVMHVGTNIVHPARR